MEYINDSEVYLNQSSDYLNLSLTIMASLVIGVLVSMNMES